MTTFQASHPPDTPVLHVFEDAGGWHWGITVQRAMGYGFKLIAFSESDFPDEDSARRDGNQTLESLAK